jgi:hypothetical protein
MITPKDLIEIEKRYDVAIYKIQWCSPRHGFRQESTVNTKRGIGFAKWADKLIKYWDKK